jgi:NADH-quinone oxidoreductase subunit C
MQDHGSPILRRLLDQHGAALRDTHARLGDATAVVERERLAEVMRFLRDDPELAFDMLTDLTCVDWLGQEPRFEMVYHLYSLAKNHRLRVKARVPESPCQIDTLTPLWASANWMEREVWDMYGVRFAGHPDLRRLLLYEEFQGHPLRKDYPKERRQPLVGPNN